MFEPEVFQKKVLVTLLRFLAPLQRFGIPIVIWRLSPLAPLITPLHGYPQNL